MKKFLTTSFILIITINIIAQSGTSKFKLVKLNSIPKPTAPAKLIVSGVTFFDDGGNKNKILDAEEKAELKLDRKSVV